MLLTRKSTAEIVLLDQTCASSDLAASELQKYLKLALDLDAPIRRKKGNADGQVPFYVGTVTHQTENGLLSADAASTDLGEEGLLIRIGDREVILAGETGVGVLYAVYVFAERLLGVRFLGAGLENEWIPQQRQVSLAKTQILEKPVFSRRGGTPYILDRLPARDFREFIEWMAKNRLNFLTFSYLEDTPHLKELADELKVRGIKLDVGGHCLHRFLYGVWDVSTPTGSGERWRIVEEKFRNHPEWHSLKNGHRVLCNDRYGHFCLSCREAVEEFCRNAIDFLKAYDGPEFLDSLSVCLSDTNAVFCECDACRKKPLMHAVQGFYNQVAERIHQVFPDLQVRFIAYEDHIAPSSRIPPARNVGIDIALWGPDYRHGLNADTPKHQRYMSIIKRWQAICKAGKGNNSLGIFQYYAFTRYSLGPRLKALFEDAVCFQQLGILRVHDNLIQAAVLEESPMALTPYFFARAFWNPSLGPEKQAQELFDPVFGPASRAMQECLHICDQLDAASITEPVWSRWRQYPLNLVQDCLSCCTETLADLGRIGEHLEDARRNSESPFAAALIDKWSDWALSSLRRVESTKVQFEVLRMLTETVERRRNLGEHTLMQKVIGKLMSLPGVKKHEGEIRKLDAEESAKLAQHFQLPEGTARYIAFLGKGKERALANVSANAVYAWQGCSFARAAEGCDQCAIIACPDFLEGPGRKRYAVREKAALGKIGDLAGNQWIRK